MTMMFITRHHHQFISSSPNFPQDQFDRIDTNHDGVIQRSEWDEAMQVWPQVQSILVGSRCLDMGFTGVLVEVICLLQTLG